jgi:hypothetical protein
MCGAGDESLVPRTNTRRDCTKVMAQIEEALSLKGKGINDIDDVVFIGVGLTGINGVGLPAVLREVMDSSPRPRVTIVDTRTEISQRSATWLKECHILGGYSLVTTEAKKFIQGLAGSAGADMPNAEALYKAFKWFHSDVPSELAAQGVWVNMAKENMKDIDNGGAGTGAHAIRQWGLRKRGRSGRCFTTMI